MYVLYDVFRMYVHTTSTNQEVCTTNCKLISEDVATAGRIQTTYRGGDHKCRLLLCVDEQDNKEQRPERILRRFGLVAIIERKQW